MEQRGKKRQAEEGDAEKIYRFKVLVPDGLTVGLRLINPGDEMKMADFVSKLKKEYIVLRRQQLPKSKRTVDWTSGRMYFEDAHDNKIRHRIDFAYFKPHKCHILKFHDGSPAVTDTYENMWDLTPDTDLLRELPEEYTFETALADLIDNSLQAVWSNGPSDRKLIRVDITKEKISIFDTGPGMDNSDENSLVKWGKMGASLHRSHKAKAIGGKPPYLTPYFGMFGYGGPIASMHLGRGAIVSSKTKESTKVYTLHLVREALLSSSRSELTWRTNGGMRNPSEEEIEESPQGCFTKVEILEPKMKNIDIFQLQCRLKDIYFPYVQACLPFMEFSQKKGDKAHLLKRCCLRVKCYIETDAGFNPTPSKTDLAHHNPFSSALKNFGSKKLDKDKEVNVEIFRGGKLLNPSAFEKEYQDWIIQMHDHYDEEVDTSEDDPILVVSPTNKRGLGISSDVVRVHRALKRKGACWKSGQKIKVLKGACPRFHKSNVYAIIEYFLIEGFQGDAGGEARIICRPMNVANEDGCILAVNDGNANLNIRGSLSLPISVVDSGKCIAIETADWDQQLEKQRLRAPSMIDVLGADHCQELEIDGALFPFDATIEAGQVPPSEIVAVVRPASFTSSSSSNSLDQKYIVKGILEMCVEVKFRREAKNCQVDHKCSMRIAPSCRKGIDGLYIFPLGERFPNLFQKAGVYMFVFSLVGSSCEDCKKIVKVRASSAVGKWKLLSNKGGQPYIVRVGSTFQTLAIACFDKYDNRIPFASFPVVTVKLNSYNRVLTQVDKVKTSLSSDKLTLIVEDVLIEGGELDEIRPTYEATLLVCSPDHLVLLSIPCKVTPGFLDAVVVRPPILEKQLLPGFVIKDLILEMFDAYGNHIAKGYGVQLNVNGFHILDQIGSNRKVDDNGCIDLSGLLKVTAGFGKTVSLSVSSDNKEIFKEFQTCRRELRLASKVPNYLIAGSQLENVVFEVVDSEGEIDETIHDEDKYSQSHTLTIKSDSFNTEGCIQYAFRHGCSTVPVISLPPNEGNVCFIASHTRYPELQLSFNVSVGPARKLDYEELQSSCPDGKILLLQDSPSPGNLALSIVNLEKGLEDDICKYGRRIRHFESLLKDLNDSKVDCELRLSKLQASLGSLSVSVRPYLCNVLNYISTKEEIIEQIKSRCNSAAAMICHLSRDLSFQEPQKHFMQDIVGIVALLGTVCTNELSRILAEYLGEEQMLAIVCSSYEAVAGLEKYKENGEVDHELALHAEVAALGKSISGRFLVICLEDLSVYRAIEESDPQRTLALPNPVLPSGSPASGFVGYAVNMINLDTHLLDIKTKAGHGLRETLFYQLFGKLQVYETREHMNRARACIMHGAVSLDGGILRASGIISLGYGDPEIRFRVEMLEEIHLSPMLMEVKKMERELQEIKNSIVKCSESLEKSMKKFRKKADRYSNFMDQVDPALPVQHEQIRNIL